MKTLNQWTANDLLNLPVRDQKDRTKEYSSVLILSRDEICEFGLGGITIIGVVGGQPMEIAVAQCEFIDWVLPGLYTSVKGNKFQETRFRTACASESGALQVWMPSAKVRVGATLRHTDICFVLVPDINPGSQPR